MSVVSRQQLFMFNKVDDSQRHLCVNLNGRANFRHVCLLSESLMLRQCKPLVNLVVHLTRQCQKICCNHAKDIGSSFRL